MKERNFVPKTETRRLCAHQPITAPGIPAVLFGGKRTWKLQPLPCCEAVLRKAIAIPHRVRSVALACQVTFLHNDFRLRYLPACPLPHAALLLLTFIRKNAVYLTTIFAGAFAFEIAFDTASNKVWDCLNRGRQWKDIKYRYLNNEEDEE